MFDRIRDALPSAAGSFRGDDRDVPVPRDALDDGIEDLVYAVNRYAETCMSCAGHEDRALAYPWVDVPGNQGLEPLEDAVATYNEDAPVAWSFAPSHYDREAERDIYRLMPWPAVDEVFEVDTEKEVRHGYGVDDRDQVDVSLDLLQDAADDLAAYLDGRT